MNYSQCNEDIFLNDLLNKKNGIVVEVGAADGITNSNSKFFVDMGWDALLIEPNPNNFKKLQDLYSEKLNVKLEMVGCSNEEKECLFFIDHNDESQQISTFSEEQKKGCQLGYGCDFSEVNSIVVPLQSLLDKYDIKSIDILSIDTEGYDYLTLLGVNFDKINIHYICIEQNNDVVENLLTSLNYKVVKITGCNAIYEKI